MNDDERDELASAYLDGEVTDEERRTVEDDPGLRSRVEELRAVSAAVARPPTAVGEDARRAAVAAALTEFSAGRIDAPPSLTAARQRSGPSWRRVLPLGAAAAALVVVAGLAINASGDDGDDASETATQSDERLEAQVPVTPRDEVVAPDAAGATAASDLADALEESGDDDTAAADGGETDSGENDSGENDSAGAPVTTTASADEAAGSNTTTAGDDGAGSGRIEHRCDEEVRAVDPELEVLLRVDGPDDDGRVTLTYSVRVEPDGERSYLVADDCGDPELVDDPAG